MQKYVAFFRISETPGTLLQFKGLIPLCKNASLEYSIIYHMEERP